MTPRELGKVASEFLSGFFDTEKPEDPAAFAEAQAPYVVPVDMVKQAVGEFLSKMMQDEPPVNPRDLDLFEQGMEHIPDDENAEFIRRKVEEARLRSEAQENNRNGNTERTGTFNPDDPEAPAWLGPSDRDS